MQRASVGSTSRCHIRGFLVSIGLAGFLDVALKASRKRAHRPGEAVIVVIKSKHPCFREPSLSGYPRWVVVDWDNARATKEAQLRTKPVSCWFQNHPCWSCIPSRFQ